MSLLPLHSGPSSIPSSSIPPTPSPITLHFLFTTSDAPLVVPISSPNTTTTHTLRTLIRSSRPNLSSRKLRLIHSGKVLPDGPSLSQILPRPTLKAKPKPDGTNNDPKGKQPDTDPDPAVIFIHCSVGPLLSPTELATESSPLLAAPTETYSSAPTPSTEPAPQGFDRLLTQGFSEREVAALRSQFNRLNPDLSPEEIRVLEDRWIDESVGQGQETIGGATAGTFEDMFIGTVIGFFWPVSIWLAREEGVFTQRRQYAVLAGFCVNLFFGLVRTFG
ncbi:DUF2407 C-terminal domain-containing protein [Pyronema omphalodes]|nr:DUF2407 C-terminal domain-containing protein [Pyronema omphalodes]